MRPDSLLGQSPCATCGAKKWNLDRFPSEFLRLPCHYHSINSPCSLTYHPEDEQRAR